MKWILPAAIASILAFASCKKTAAPILPITTTNNVLLLKVDYLTNAFESGKELVFTNTAPSFTISQQYVTPSDFGSLQLTYQELNEPLFSGTIVWIGLGQMHFPQNLLPANQFDRVVTADVVTPAAGFQNIFNPSNYSYDYTPIWMAVQNIVKVRQYLLSNPTATIKLFLYTPSVGVGNPADWDWIIMLKN